MPAAKQLVSFVTFPLAQIIARDLGVREAQVESTITLIEEGATIPFIARYRKERTGGLDDTQLRKLAERYEYLTELQARRETILTSISDQGKLTPALERALCPRKPKWSWKTSTVPTNRNGEPRQQSPVNKGSSHSLKNSWPAREIQSASLRRL